MSVLIINGVRIEAPPGSHVQVVNGRVLIDGQESAQISGDSITIDTARTPIRVQCDRDVTVLGYVTGGVEAGGAVNCGDVTGGVRAQGDVKCDNVVGGVHGRDVRCGGNIIGGVHAQRFNPPA